MWNSAGPQGGEGRLRLLLAKVEFRVVMFWNAAGMSRPSGPVDALTRDAKKQLGKSRIYGAVCMTEGRFGNF